MPKAQKSKKRERCDQNAMRAVWEEEGFSTGYGGIQFQSKPWQRRKKRK